MLTMLKLFLTSLLFFPKTRMTKLITIFLLATNHFANLSTLVSDRGVSILPGGPAVHVVQLSDLGELPPGEVVDPDRHGDSVRFLTGCWAQERRVLEEFLEFLGVPGGSLEFLGDS